MWQSLWFSVQEIATAQSQGQGKSPGISTMLFPILMMFGVMYFLMIMPNQRKDKRRKEMLAALSKGDEVVTQGGMVGTIVGLSEKSIVLKVSDNPNVKIEFLRQAVSQVAKDDDKGSKDG